jgi:ribosomal protein S18 acetylase RimI-like enzyme
MATLGSGSDSEADPTSETESEHSQDGVETGTEAVFHDLTLSDFLPRPTETETTVEQLNDFFNSSRIKQELHWFTHRDTLVRAFKRDDRELFYVQPQEHIVAASMVWCESRVLDPKQAQIRLIATHPNHRGHGLARMLVDACLSFARSRGQTEMIADVAKEAPATQFWRACEFELEDTYETDGGRTMLRMSREI